MKIVGVGCCPGMLTESAIEILRRAKKCYGSDRAIRIAEPYLQPDCICVTITDFKNLRELRDKDVVILSTGDPMLGGLGDLKGEVVPGISSLQLACARLKIPWLKVVPLTAHGMEYKQVFHSIAEEIVRGKIVFLLADPEIDPRSLSLLLREQEIFCDIAVCENLGYPGERIEVGSTVDPPGVNSSLFSLLLGHFR